MIILLMSCLIKWACKASVSWCGFLLGDVKMPNSYSKSNLFILTYNGELVIILSYVCMLIDVHSCLLVIESFGFFYLYSVCNFVWSLIYLATHWLNFGFVMICNIVWKMGCFLKNKCLGSEASWTFFCEVSGYCIWFGYSFSLTHTETHMRDWTSRFCV